jgi:hypothetical protein
VDKKAQTVKAMLRIKPTSQAAAAGHHDPLRQSTRADGQHRGGNQKEPEKSILWGPGE